MTQESSRNLRLGLLVTAGTVFLVIAMYLIGDKQNLFGNTFRISADFRDVNGLMVGNNVRFGGINVGTVESIEITSDSTINVVMNIENESMPFIKKNALASIGTDGLMGNKLININIINQPAESVADGDTLLSLEAIETDQMLRTLNRTNEDIAVIVSNLKMITMKVNSPNSFWNILMDTVVAENVKSAIVDIKFASQRAAVITGDLTSIMKDIKAGKGSIGALLTDSTISSNLKQTIVKVNVISDSLAYITGDLKYISGKLKQGEGTIGSLLMDTTFVPKLNKSMENIESGSKGFDDNMEALKHSFLLRSYFKKQEKKATKK